jgi:hypothetical protein
MMSERIKTGFCVAYDWYLLEHALPLVYGHSDAICLSIDRDRISWAQNKFEFDQEAFSKLIKKVDIEGKITVYEDNFHSPGLSPMENEVRQRNLMAARMGEGGWHIQLDCDEYFLNFSQFVKFLRSMPPSNNPFNVSCAWITLFKKIDAGFLYIMPANHSEIEYIQVATRTPVYEFGRRNAHFNLYTNYKILHQSWARTSEEINTKISNWGHKDDFDSKQYFAVWNDLTKTNYVELRDFHPIEPSRWHSLHLAQFNSIHDLVNGFDSNEFISLPRTALYFKNSRFFAKLRKLKSIIFR